MNWAAKDYSEIALNQIWSEHVRAIARQTPAHLRAHTRKAGAWGGDRGGGGGDVSGSWVR